MVKKEIADWLKVFNEVTVPTLIENGFKPTPVNAREGLANLTKGLTTTIDHQEMGQVFDDLIITEGNEYNVPVRIYSPKSNQTEKLPVIVFYHGGGHMAGSVSVYDPICRKLANTSNHIVVSVEYRVAPENPFPAGKNDCINAAKFVFNTLDSRGMSYERRLVIAGDSGGAANTTYVAAMLQDDETVKIDKQVIIYPSVDYTMGTKSMKENGVGYLLQESKIAWYFNNYFANNEDRAAVSPINMKMSDKMPETLIFTAQFDPLRDEGMEYGKKLEAAGVKVESHNIENMIHTFMSMEDLCKDECNFVYEKISKFLNK